MNKEQIEAAKVLAEYTLENERENYDEFCEENNENPKAIRTINHVYAKALLTLGLEYEES